MSTAIVSFKDIIKESVRVSDDTRGFFLIETNQSAVNDLYRLAASDGGKCAGHSGSYSYTDWINEINNPSECVKALNNARAFVESSGVVESFNATMENIKSIRKRRFSDCNGDFDYDRRLDVQCLVETYKDKQAASVLTIRAKLNFNSMADDDVITQYGATCLAIAEAIERSGTQVRLIAEFQSDSVYQDKKHTVTQVLVKEANQYSDYDAFSIGFHANAFRKAIFVLRCAVGKAHKIKAAQGINHCGAGTALKQNVLPEGQGELFLDYDTVAAALRGNTSELTKRLNEKLGKART